MATTQTDILASQPVSSNGQALAQNGGTIGRCRVKSMSIVPGASAGTLVLSDGGSGGPIRITVPTVGSATQPMYMLLPGEGLLFQTNVYVSLTNVGSVVLIYA